MIASPIRKICEAPSECKPSSSGVPQNPNTENINPKLNMHTPHDTVAAIGLMQLAKDAGTKEGQTEGRRGRRWRE